MDQNYELDEHGVHPLWNQGVHLAEELDRAFAMIGATGGTDWQEIRRVAAELVEVADKAIAEGPVDGLV